MKFDHRFSVTDHNDSSFFFKSENINARLDFLEKAVRVAVYRDGERLFPTFAVCPDGNMPYEGRDKLSLEGLKTIIPKVSQGGPDDPGLISFSFEDIRIDLDLQNFRMNVYKGDALLFHDREYMAYNLDHEFGPGSRHFISREEDEFIFGLGDKTGNVNKDKQIFKLGTDDAMGFDARSSDPLYKHVPFYICRNSAGSYGLYYDTYSDGEFNFGREINKYYTSFKSFSCEEETLVYYLFFGDESVILNSFSRLCGGIFMPPEWTLRYCGSTMAYTDADNAGEQLEGFLEKCEKYGIHPGGFYLSSGYTQIGERRFVFHWNTDKIPSPEGLSSLFRSKGVEFLPNVKPCFLTDHPLYKEIAEHGWFLKYADGSPAMIPFWGGMGSYLDFTNPGAASFWTEHVKRDLVDKGYRYSWNDNNEYDIRDDDIYACGFGEPIRAKLIKPLFSYLMTRASLAACDDGSEKNAVSRCGATGIQRIASTWTGDNRTSFEDFRYNHKMAMTMSLSGIYNFGQDIGGFAGPRPSKELFLRWIQYGIFTPRFVLHSYNTDGSSNMPWLYEDETDTVKRLFDLRERLIPYLYGQFRRSADSFDPVIYPVFLKQKDYDPESDVFFFGDDILACPVFDEGAENVTLTLPEGEWCLGSDVYEKSGSAVESGSPLRSYIGGATLTLPCGIRDLPVFFVRKGAKVF